MKFGATQLYLNSGQCGTIGQEGPPLRVALTQGTLGFSSNAGDQFEIDTPVGIVRGADGQRAFGEVTILGPRTILVAAYHGSLVVAGSGVQRTIPEGDSYNVTFVPDAAPGGAEPSALPPAGSPKPGLSTHGDFDVRPHRDWSRGWSRLCHLALYDRERPESSSALKTIFQATFESERSLPF